MDDGRWTNTQRAQATNDQGKFSSFVFPHSGDLRVRPAYPDTRDECAGLRRWSNP